MGHSYGGFVATRVAAHHPEAKGVVLIAPWSPAQDVAALSVAPPQFAAAAHSAFDDVEGRLGSDTDIDLAKEILDSGYDWRLESSAAAIKNLPILIVVAKHDSPDDQAKELVSAMKAAHASDTTTVQMDTDHAFTDHRIALESAVLAWLRKNAARPAKSGTVTARPRISTD
jgi:pimeloyl-ACP methyl ester carboxylesterase